MTTIIDILGTSGPNPFDAPIQNLVSTQESSALAAARSETATHLIMTITTAAHPLSKLYQLWDAFFRAAIASVRTYAPHLALLDALRERPLTQPTSVVAKSNEATQLIQYTKADGKLHWSELPGFGWQWRDVHDVLEAHRDWDSTYAFGPRKESSANGAGLTGGEYYLRFCRFRRHC